MAWTFDLCGGQLALDFANTVSARHTDQPIERITSYDDLVEFARQTQLVSDREARRLRATAARQPDDAARVWQSAVALRDAVFEVFAAVAREQRPDDTSLGVLNDALSRLRLDAALEWAWDADPRALDGFLGPIVKAALALVAPEQRTKIHMCEAPDCVWLFYDTSRNHSRRWCDMNQCGNRMKARRHHARARA